MALRDETFRSLRDGCRIHIGQSCTDGRPPPPERFGAGKANTPRRPCDDGDLSIKLEFVEIHGDGPVASGLQAVM